jgi:tRNA pseudouridine38-40 synthase
MPTFKIVVAYDGTGFVGWQRQASGVTVQALIEDALQPLEDRPVTVHGAGRTDAGVHAVGQVASFTLTRDIDAGSVVRALNFRLPPDVRVLSAAEAPPAFHARFDARAKTYRYRIWTGDVVSPFERRYVWHVPGPLDVAAMASAAELFEGRHDFAAFQAAENNASSTERTLQFSRLVSAPPPQIVYEVSGDGFLRHMVRTMVGSLVEVGRGRRRPEWIRDVVGSRDRREAGPTAPAAGLFLMGVHYDERACG